MTNHTTRRGGTSPLCDSLWLVVAIKPPKYLSFVVWVRLTTAVRLGSVSGAVDRGSVG
jgi:hypothetical protein